MGVFRELREKLNIVEVVSRDTRLVRTGNAGQFTGLCPFHDDDKPSFSVNEHLGVWFCFACNEGGTVVDYIAKKFNAPKDEVPNIAREVYGVELSGGNDSFSEEDKKRRDAQYTVLKLFYEKFNTEENRKKALNYLKKRAQFVTEELIKELGIFYVPRDSDSFLKLLSDDELYYAAIEVGLIKEPESGKHEAFVLFKNRVVFPIFYYGRLVGFNARAVSDKAKVKYLLTKKGLVFAKKKILWGLDYAQKLAKEKELDYIYLTEGVMDALTFLSLGVPAVAYLGSSVSISQWRLLNGAFNHVVLAPDGDGAGFKGALKSIESAMDANYTGSGSVILFPGGQDANSYAARYRQIKNDPEPVLKAFRSLRQRSFEDFYIDYFLTLLIKSKISNDKEVLKQALLSRVLPRLVDRRKTFLGASIVSRIAQRTGVDWKFIQIRLERGIEEAKKELKKEVEIPEEFKHPISSIEMRFLGTIYYSPNLFESIRGAKWLEILHPMAKELANALYQAFTEGKDFVEILKNGYSDETWSYLGPKYLQIVSLLPVPVNDADAAASFYELVKILEARWRVKNDEIASEKAEIAAKELINTLETPMTLEEKKALIEYVRETEKKGRRKKNDQDIFDEIKRTTEIMKKKVIRATII